MAVRAALARSLARSLTHSWIEKSWERDPCTRGSESESMKIKRMPDCHGVGSYGLS